MKGYTMNGSREIVEVATEALASLPAFLDEIGDDAEIAEFRAYENEPTKVTIGTTGGFTMYDWTREGWVEA